MGQSVSSPENSSNDDGNDSSNDEERNNLANLTNIQLKNLLQQPRTISAQDILRAARNGAFSSQATESLTSGFYTSENDSELILLAIRINNLSPDLSKLRFKLVPSKIKEPVFWEVVIGLLRERRADELATTGFSGDNDNDYDVNENTNASTCNGNNDELSLPRRDSENPSVQQLSRYIVMLWRHSIFAFRRRPALSPFLVVSSLLQQSVPSVWAFGSSSRSSSTGSAISFTTERDGSGTITVSPKNEGDQSALVVICHGLGDTAEGFVDVAEVS
jgi:hypothetical protein